MISVAQNRILEAPHLLFFPGLFLSLTVFAFILMGDALRDALDPKLR
jgi:ABC-type dipeptide/oligopeptide/nickel transport system permease subunit